MAPGPFAPTPSQTIGPFFGHALPFPGGGDIVPAATPGAVVVRGTVRDGAGAPIPDALLEFWQAGPDGSRAGAPGSLRRDLSSGRVPGRSGLDFTGFARVATDPDGSYFIRTLRPAGVPYLSVCLFARGLLHHLYTRVYFADDAESLAADSVLGALPEARRDTLLARKEREGVFRFDIRVQAADQGADETVLPEETVFLEFR